MRNKKTFLLIFFIFIILVPSVSGALRELHEGTKIEPFIVVSLSGKSFSYHQLSGKKGTLIFFWSTNTKNSTKALEILQEKYSVWKEKGLQILAINVEKQYFSEDDIKALKQSVDSKKITIPVLIDKGLILFDKFGVIALPSMVLIDDKMTIYKEISGFPLVGSQVFFDEVSIFLGEKKVTETKIAYKPAKQSLLAYQLGLRFEKKKDFERAVEMYEKAISVDSAFVLPYGRLFDIYINLNKISSVKNILSKADKSLLKKPLIMMNIGKVYFHENDLVNAKKILLKSIAEEEFVDVFIYLGFISYIEGNISETERLFLNAVSISNNSPEALNKIGRFYALKGNNLKANEYYKKALEEILKTKGR